MALPSVQTIISYPTLLGQQLTPAEMTNHISSLATLMADQMPEGVSLASPEVKAILTPEMMQMLGGFTVLRMTSMMSMVDISMTKEELLAMNKKLNKIKKPKNKKK